MGSLFDKISAEELGGFVTLPLFEKEGLGEIY
jgi:hypothetical protein